MEQHRKARTAGDEIQNNVRRSFRAAGMKILLLSVVLITLVHFWALRGIHQTGVVKDLPYDNGEHDMCIMAMREQLRFMPTTTNTSQVKLSQIFVVATRSKLVAAVIQFYLAGAGIPHQVIGRTSKPWRDYYQYDSGVALIGVFEIPFGLPRNIPVVYVVDNPQIEAACSVLSQHSNAAVGGTPQIINKVMQRWEASVGDWIVFGRLHGSNFTVLNIGSLPNVPQNFELQLLHALGLSQAKISAGTQTQQAQEALYQAVSPVNQQICEILDSKHNSHSIGCFSNTCDPSTGLLRQIPCNSSHGTVAGPLDSVDTTTFESPRFARLLYDSPRRFVGTTRKVCLIVSYYADADPLRAKELLLALTANVQNPYIDQVHLFVSPTDTSMHVIDSWTASKVVIHYTNRQPTHKDAIMYANAKLPGQIVIFSNADIVFAASIALVHNLMPGQAMAISRHVSAFPEVFHGSHGNYTPSNNMCLNYIGSHDTFVYVSPINHSVADRVDHVQNLWGSENVVIFELQKAGVYVTNPCRSIISFHVHNRNDRPTDRPRINQHRSGVVVPSSLAVCPSRGAVACEIGCWRFSSKDGLIHQTHCRPESKWHR